MSRFDIRFFALQFACVEVFVILLIIIILILRTLITFVLLY
jgi:hypothetical protein